jgi:hypothetical protein
MKLVSVDQKSIRLVSLLEVRRLGYLENPDLPLGAAEIVFRTRDEIVDRALALSCAVAVANNSNPAVALAWLEREGLLASLTDAERHWLTRPSEHARARFSAQEEALLSLVWSLSFARSLDFTRYCDPSLAAYFPKIRDGESSERFRDAAVLREATELASMVDLAYCLHWSIRDSQLRRRPTPGVVEPYVVEERRRGLEWLVSDQGWDEISLDT